MSRILFSLILLVACASAPARAEEPRSTSVWSFSEIRTLPGKTDEYLAFLSTTWKAQREILRDEGAVLSYHVYLVRAQREGEPDIILATEFADYVSLERREELEAIVRARIAADPDLRRAQVDLDTLRVPLGNMDVEELELP